MSLKEKLPKAPQLQDDGPNIEDVVKNESAVIESENENKAAETPLEQKAPKPKVKGKADEQIDVRPELMDTSGFDDVLKTASQARMLAAQYTMLAEGSKLPDKQLLLSDASLAEAIRTTLIRRAEDFDKVSRGVLASALEDDSGDASIKVMLSDEVADVKALHEIMANTQSAEEENLHGFDIE